MPSPSVGQIVRDFWPVFLFAGGVIGQAAVMHYRVFVTIPRNMTDMKKTVKEKVNKETCDKSHGAVAQGQDTIITALKEMRREQREDMKGVHERLDQHMERELDRKPGD